VDGTACAFLWWIDRQASISSERLSVTGLLRCAKLTGECSCCCHVCLPLFFHLPSFSLSSSCKYPVIALFGHWNLKS
jgi:hypothetical protein